MGPLKLSAVVEQWPMRVPFRITGHLFDVIDVLVVRLECDGRAGRSEAAGIYYRGDTPTDMLRTVSSLRPSIEAGISREELQHLLPAGGARNAIDCALWDLETKLTGRAAWEIAGLPQPRPLRTTFTCGADEPEVMADTARFYASARAIKLKLTGTPLDADRVRAVRAARPDVWLGVDANQGFTRASLEQLMPVLVDEKVSLIEQPFPVGQEALLDGFRSPVPVAADETAQQLSDLPALVGRFDVVNIKLDKSGGLTGSLAMAHAARELGLATMVGNMLGTSLAMAPAFLVGQLCSIVDLDGPVLLKADRPLSMQYVDGDVYCPDFLWGHPDSAGE